jgi:hypothetical protein
MHHVVVVGLTTRTTILSVIWPAPVPVAERLDLYRFPQAVRVYHDPAVPGIYARVSNQRAHAWAQAHPAQVDRLYGVWGEIPAGTSALAVLDADQQRVAGAHLAARAAQVAAMQRIADADLAHYLAGFAFAQTGEALWTAQRRAA